MAPPKNRAVLATEAAPTTEAKTLVKVKANGWIGEQINGVQKTFKPGDVFELAPDRVAALGKNVTPL
jgi:hypothetical protein